MRVTLKDVAKVAGVSIKTVSRVVNNQGEISEATKQRVLDAINQLGYKPNQLARSLITGKTQTIGIIIPDISDPFFPELILGAENVAREQGYNVFLCNANREPDLELKYVELLNQRRVDGLIIAGSRLNTAGLEIAAKVQPSVIMSPYDIPGALLCMIDGFGGGKKLGEYLISLGHRKIGYIEGNWESKNDQRYLGLVSAMQSVGLPTDKVLVETVNPLHFDNGYQIGNQILSNHPEITALVCYNDMVALGVMQGCRAANLRIPEDISITGFDDIPEASRTSPSLTTIRIDRSHLGEQMMARLLDTLEKKEFPTERIVWTGELVIRQSCAAPHQL